MSIALPVAEVVRLPVARLPKARPTSRKSHDFRYAALALWVGVLLLAGCGGTPELGTEYGQRQSPRAAGSVNGVGVLADMFEDQGHRITTWHRLSPRIRENNVIVWAPDDFSPPSPEARRFLEAWLSEEDDRTLVYIGRDYDAAIEYWNSVLPGAPPDEAEAIERRLARSRSEFDSARAALPAKEYARWFLLDNTQPRREVRQLSGSWVEQLNGAQAGLDATKSQIEIRSRLKIPTDGDIPAAERGDLEFTPLLASGADALVTRVTFADDYEPEPGGEPDPAEPMPDDTYTDWYEDDYDPGPSNSQILVVTNGSFLLNLPLVNHQHRLLAGKLIEECEGYEALQVAVLESGPDVPVYDREPQSPSYLDLLRKWPMNVILLHALGLGVLFCFVFYPIFGRPVERTVLRVEQGVPIFAGIGSESTGPSDFGKHIDALGEMMARTQEQQYAQARLDHYQQHVKRDSGLSHKARAK